MVWNPSPNLNQSLAVEKSHNIKPVDGSRKGECHTNFWPIAPKYACKLLRSTSEDNGDDNLLIPTTSLLLPGVSCTPVIPQFSISCFSNTSSK